VFGEKRVEAALDPSVQLMKEAAHVRLTVIRAPAANHGIHVLDHLAQFHWGVAAREPADLVLEARHALLARHNIQVLSIRPAAPLGRRQPVPFPLFDLVAKELKGVVSILDILSCRKSDRFAQGA
jgi:hypothetical protein